MAKGGNRKNAGRKKGSKNKELKKKLINHLTEKDIEDIIKQGLRLVRGVKGRKHTKTGEDIYDVPPNPHMIADFMRHIFGTPSPALLISPDSEDKNAINISIIDYTDKDLPNTSP